MALLGIRGPGIVFIKDKPRFVREALAKQMRGTDMARDVKEHAKDLDGLAKNLDKLKTEGEKMQDAARKAMQGDSHDKVMDAVTEATRASPYGMAHLVVAVVVVLVIALGVALVI